eukprot:COSAG05_NODE_10633_length_554_cov_1.136264_1_plen_49_part_10
MYATDSRRAGRPAAAARGYGQPGEHSPYKCLKIAPYHRDIPNECVTRMH